MGGLAEKRIQHPPKIANQRIPLELAKCTLITVHSILFCPTDLAPD
ncbi:hypothetical protein RMSM_06319 [Rhodopirellula maiorica SM1]|uniref:Uncharacterized protein n=1 Tax=Rhodopirellula maiorica SM1 TaxID=1265738 RepID=M5RBJ8_9BACT|nr:hypothetical protein RMSM_06319 [Rhodopirellula maiorica SM1]